MYGYRLKEKLYGVESIFLWTSGTPRPVPGVNADNAAAVLGKANLSSLR
jgi:hypothetical protein